MQLLFLQPQDSPALLLTVLFLTAASNHHFPISPERWFMEVHVVHGNRLTPSSALFTNFRSNTGKLRFISRCHTHFDIALLTASETPLANHSWLSTVTLLSCHHPLMLNLGRDSVLIIGSPSQKWGYPFWTERVASLVALKIWFIS